jgi:hypothetical protein
MCVSLIHRRCNQTNVKQTRKKRGAKARSRVVCTYGVNLPLVDIFLYLGLDEIRIPPHLGVVLKAGMVQCLASRWVDA